MMNTKTFYNSKQPKITIVWTCTDDDFAQYVSRDIYGQKFRLVQVNRIGLHYQIAHSIVDIDCYDEDDILSALQAYGYDSMDDFVEQASPVIIPRLKNGQLDKESFEYIIDYQLIAEMLFELEAIDNLLPVKYSTFEDAEAAVIKMITENGGKIE